MIKTHTIQIYDMVPPSAEHPSLVTGQYGDQRLSLALPGMPIGTAIVTITGLSVSAGAGVWIKFGESGPGFPGTFWLTGGVGNGVGTTHFGLVYDNKNYYGPGKPLHYFVGYVYHGIPTVGYVSFAIQVALGGFVIPAQATIGLLGLGALAIMRRRRAPRVDAKRPSRYREVRSARSSIG